MTCSDCHSKPARAGQSKCHACHAAYMKTWRQTSGRKREERAFKRGVEAYKAIARQAFMLIGRAELSGYTAVQILDNCAAKVPRGTLT